MTLLDQHSQAIGTLCRAHKVKKLYAFGSVLTSSFSPDSDIDLVVDFEPIELHEYADNYFDLKFALEDLLHRPVDLLEEQAIKNPYFRLSIESKKQLIYGN